MRPSPHRTGPSEEEAQLRGHSVAQYVTVGSEVRFVATELLDTGTVVRRPGAGMSVGWTILGYLAWLYHHDWIFTPYRVALALRYLRTGFDRR